METTVSNVNNVHIVENKAGSSTNSNQTPASLSLTPDSAELNDDLQRVKLLFGFTQPTSDEMIPSTVMTKSCSPSLQIAVVIQPTDPAFDKLHLLPEGLQIRVFFFYINESILQQCELSTTVSRPSKLLKDYHLATELTVLNPFPPCMKEAFEAVGKQGFQTYAGSLYQTLKMLERSITSVFEYGRRVDLDGYNAYRKQFGPLEWTREEQLRLEEALIWYGKVVDQKQKWRNIARHVGGGRSARECAQRFEECRNAVLDKLPASQNPVAGTATCSALAPPSSSSLQKEGNTASFDGVSNDMSSHRVNLVNLEAKNISLLYLSNARVVLKCCRCNTSLQVCMRLPRPLQPVCDDDDVLLFETGGVSKHATARQNCSKCSESLSITWKAAPAFATCPVIGTWACEGCALEDVLPSEFFVECSECSAALECRNVFTGTTRELVCRRCHTSLQFKFDALDFEGCERSNQLVQAIKKPPKERLGLKLGTSLPQEGTCKHYKKSYRWLRFPCCGRAFPCDICHDEQMDHPCEWATRMICGHCSKEQPYSQKPCACGGSMTAARSSHWEGGRGCRDPVRMSRKDNKKERASLLRYRSKQNYQRFLAKHGQFHCDVAVGFPSTGRKVPSIPQASSVSHVAKPLRSQETSLCSENVVLDSPKSSEERLLHLDKSVSRSVGLSYSLRRERVTYVQCQIFPRPADTTAVRHSSFDCLKDVLAFPEELYEAGLRVLEQQYRMQALKLQYELQFHESQKPRSSLNKDLADPVFRTVGSAAGESPSATFKLEEPQCLDAIEKLNSENLKLAFAASSASGNALSSGQSPTVGVMDNLKEALLALNPEWKGTPEALVSAAQSHLSGKRVEIPSSVYCPEGQRRVHEGFRHVCHIHAHNLEIEQIYEDADGHQKSILRQVPVVQVYADPPVWVLSAFLTKDECDYVTALACQRCPALFKGASQTIFSSGEIDDTIQRLFTRIALACQVSRDALNDAVIMSSTLQTADAQPQLEASEYRSTFVIFLNGLSEGGEIDFIELGFQVQPQIGTAVLWHNVEATPEGNFHSTTPDMRLLHVFSPPRRADETQLQMIVHVQNQFRPAV